MSHVYGSDGRVRRPIKKLYTLDKENVARRVMPFSTSLHFYRLSRKGVVSSPITSQEERETSSQDATTRQPCKRGQEKRIQEMLHSSLRMGSSEGASGGLTAVAGKDREAVTARPPCKAKAALYASSIRLSDDMDAPAMSAPAQRLLSHLKRLEVSGTAGNLASPDPEACVSRVSRKAPLSMARGQQASSIILAGDSPCGQDSAAHDLRARAPLPEPELVPVPKRRLRARAPTPPSVRRQNRERVPSNRPPPGGASSVVFG